MALKTLLLDWQPAPERYTADHPLLKGSTYQVAFNGVWWLARCDGQAVGDTRSSARDAAHDASLHLWRELHELAATSPDPIERRAAGVLLDRVIQASLKMARIPHPVSRSKV